jgi:HD superfamily phosphohydrolase
MDFLKGIQDLDEYVISNRRNLSAEGLIGYFRDVLAGLAHLHSRKIVHCDVKPANLLVADGTPALVADLGYAKHFPRVPRHDDSLTTVTYTPPYAHPLLRQHMIESADSNANKAEIRAEDLKEVFDLYAFGRTMQQVLTRLAEAEASDRQSGDRHGEGSLLSPYQWQFLELVARRLLDGQATEPARDVIPGLPPKAMNDLRYPNAGDALEDVEKLLSLYDLEGELPELNPHRASYVQVPLSKVPLTPRVARLMNHPHITRLGQVTQLGFVSLVYPGATHTRLEHVLGTFSTCCDYIRSLWYDENSCLFRSIMRREDLELVLVASLLHDVSQYPMAHDLSEVSSEFAHEAFIETFLRATHPAADGTIAQLILDDWHSDVENVLEVISPSMNSSVRVRILNSILSGPLDCDKMDYLRRDALRLGVMFGHSVDCERILRNLTVVYDSEEVAEPDASGRTVTVSRLRKAEIGVFEKALAASRGMWRARQDMFTQVYWQHTVRSFKAMLGFSVRRIILALETDSQRASFWREFQDWLFDWRSVMGTAMPSTRPPVEIELDTEGMGFEAIEDSGSWTSLAPTDDSLLEFLMRHADPVGREVLRQIRERKPFRRIAVLSRGISGERYDDLYYVFRGLRLDEDFVRMEDLRRRWEVDLINVLERQLQERGVSTLPGGMESEEAISEMRLGSPILLVDVPIKATRSSRGRESMLYLPEDVTGVHARITHFPRIAEVPINLEQESFDREVGKIRVFVAPRWAGAIARHLSDRAITDIIQT